MTTNELSRGRAARTVSILLLACAAPRVAAQTCPPPALPADCGALVPGTPLPFDNAAAPDVLTLPPGTTTVDLVILGHSENRGYHTYLQPLLDANPPVAGVTFNVTNWYLAGQEAWRWATPGQAAWDRIQDVKTTFTANPVIVLGLFSNNVTFPITNPVDGDTNYERFLSDLTTIADELHNGGDTALMVYLSAHRFKPSNVEPCWNENCAIGGLMDDAQASGKGYVQRGPEQHDLHWCCFPSCYASDMEHTNDAGDQLMAETWYEFLVAELGGNPGTGTDRFCDASDGALAACPCGNAGAPDTGCDLQQGTGGVGLAVVAQTTSPANRVTWAGTGFPAMSAPTAIVIRGGALAAASPLVFGDGLRCVDTPLVRLAASFASGGTSQHVHGHSGFAGPGSFYYQLWFRNTPSAYCTPDAFNLSNGRRLAW